MLSCKRQYEVLQGKTVEIVRDLNAYSLLQEVRSEFLPQKCPSLYR